MQILLMRYSKMKEREELKNIILNADEKQLERIVAIVHRFLSE